MLELIQKHIHMNRFKGNTTTQVTLDDDFIVPDTMDDMAQVILSSGDVVLESVKNQGERVLVKGKLTFQVLYRKAEGGLQTLAGSIAIEEPVNVSGLDEKDQVSVAWELEDLSSGMINSRKLNVKAIVTLKVRVETLCSGEAAVDVSDNEGSWNGGAGAGEGTGSWSSNRGNEIAKERDNRGLQLQKRTVDVATIAVHRKDTFRIKEDISLSGSKPSIEQVLWSQMQLLGTSAKPVDGRVLVEGGLSVFLIYEGEGENTPVQWLEEVIPFSGEVELTESVEGMIPSINLKLVHKEMEAKPDYDGEMRQVEVDAVLELDMKLYEEQPLELLQDIYATDREMELTRGIVEFDRLLAKNTGKCKLAEKVSLESGDRILQVCHNEAVIKVDEVIVQEDALEIDGVLEVSLLYMTSDDVEPVKAAVAAVPFQYMAEAPGIGEDSVYQLNTGVEQMTAVMAGSDLVEVRAVLSLDILVFQPVSQAVITEAKESPLDLEKLQALPGIVGYIVQPGDTLWDVAKRFHTTVAHVMEENELSDDAVRPGQRLLLVKEVAGGRLG